MASKQDALAQSVINKINLIGISLKELETEIRQLWAEFDQLKAGETILGAGTKKEFCALHLNRTPRAVAYMLGGGNKKRTQATVEVLTGKLAEALEDAYNAVPREENSNTLAVVRDAAVETLTTTISALFSQAAMFVRACEVDADNTDDMIIDVKSAVLNEALQKGAVYAGIIA